MKKKDLNPISKFKKPEIFTQVLASIIREDVKGGKDVQRRKHLAGRQLSKGKGTRARKKI